MGRDESVDIGGAEASTATRVPVPLLSEQSLPLARYRFEWLVERPIHLPEYAGSTLRGAFGGALRQLACMTGAPHCHSCTLYRSCPYPAIFETPAPEQHNLQRFSQVPNPYVIEPPPWGARSYGKGERLSFHHVLLGPALTRLPLVIQAWQRAFAHGVAHGSARLHTVWLEQDSGSQCVFDKGQLQAHSATLAPQAPTGGPVVLQFHTPLRLQDNGRPLGPDRIDEQRLLLTLARRIDLLLELQLGRPSGLDFTALKHASQQVRGQRQLHWRDWTRYSSRQHQTMALGGVVGTWQLEGAEPFHTLLHLGQWLHVGKNATFGLGGYRMHLDTARVRVKPAAAQDTHRSRDVNHLPSDQPQLEQPTAILPEAACQATPTTMPQEWSG